MEIVIWHTVNHLDALKPYLQLIKTMLVFALIRNWGRKKAIKKGLRNVPNLQNQEIQTTRYDLSAVSLTA